MHTGWDEVFEESIVWSHLRWTVLIRRVLKDKERMKWGTGDAQSLCLF